DEATMPDDAADAHARDRLETGFDLNEVVAEYTILRQTMMSWLARDSMPEESGALRAVNHVIDRAMAAAVARYTAARDRALQAFDRIASASLEYRDLGDLLERLLQVFMETTAAVDTATILLREGDELSVRACVGLEGHGEMESQVKIGEGFAGKIAHERAPLFLASASDSPLVPSEAHQNKGVCAVYGVPLMNRDEVIGVAHIGSCSAREFSQQDRVLFLALANRATTAILQGLLRARLERERARLQTIVEQLPAGVVIAEVPSGRLILGNEQVSKIWRRPFTASATVEQYRQDWEGFDPETGRRLEPHEWALARAVTEGVAVSQEVEILRGDNTRAIVLNSAAPIREEGRIVAGVATFVDLTSHKEALRAREEILSIVSHDLRNPLNVVSMSSAVLQQAMPEDVARARKATEAIARASQRMTRLIDDLIDFASIQSNRLSIQRAPHDARRLMEDARSAFETIAADKGLHFECHIVDELPHVNCDRDRVLQIFSNFIGNAIKHTPSGGNITIGAAEGLGTVHFWVTDSGPGIAGEELPHIFDRYWKGTRASREGSGLGLAIAKGLVSAHGGHIWVESQVGVGSTFHFSVPTARKPDQG
ncbi:MAG TPA: ATP-binding protein, partial [Polyangiaceae bacterium]|nr:ATP-binding protein [Polyangiaceae bacterium]